MQIFLWIAAVLGFVTFLVHTFAGGKAVARPLLNNDTMPPASKWLNYYCWHITTIVIVFIAAGYAWVAGVGPNTELILFLSALTASLSLLSAGVAMKAGIHPLRFPSTFLFAFTSIAGWAAVFSQQ